MPKDKGAELMLSPFEPRFGEVPATRVLDLEDNMTVRCIEAPDERTMAPVLAAFTKACHRASPPRLDLEGHVPIAEVLGGGALWQAMETLHFTLLVAGVSRVFTHQLVRARIGVTFSQQCFGDHDCRHADLLYERCYLASPKRLEQSIRLCVDAKMLYADQLDGNVITLQSARYDLPHRCATFIYVHGSLNALASLYAKRCCTMTQAWEMVLFAGRLRSAVLAAAPWATEAFRNPCQDGRCYYQRARKSGFAVTNFYEPDAEHDRFEWSPRSFVYRGTHAERSSGVSPVPTRYFVGPREVSESKYSEHVEHNTAGGLRHHG